MNEIKIVCIPGSHSNVSIRQNTAAPHWLGRKTDSLGTFPFPPHPQCPVLSWAYEVYDRKKERRQYGRFYAQKCIKHTTKLKVITLSVRKDSKAVDIVSVTVVNLHAFTRHHPPSYTGVITAGEKLHVVYHREPSHTVLMTCRTHISNISVKHCISTVPQSLQMVTPSGEL